MYIYEVAYICVCLLSRFNQDRLWCRVIRTQNNATHKFHSSTNTRFIRVELRFLALQLSSRELEKGVFHLITRDRTDNFYLFLENLPGK